MGREVMARLVIFDADGTLTTLRGSSVGGKRWMPV